ncbi:MAG: hypothetical protein ACHQFW_07940, partial [Chitinophagales bacterium]
MKQLPLLVVFILITNRIFSQGLFVQIYDYGYVTQIHDMKQTTDGGYILAGSIKDSLTYNTDWLIVKTDLNGEPEWSKIIESPDNNGSAKYIFQTPDGGYLVAGSEAYDSGVKYNSIVRKLSAGGDSIWTTVHTMAPISLPCNRFTMTDDGGYLCGWNYASDVFMVSRGTAEGETLWTENYNGFNPDNSDTRLMFFEGHIYITGLHNSAGGGSGWEYGTYLWKLDTLGNIASELYIDSLAGKIQLITDDNNLIF